MPRTESIERISHSNPARRLRMRIALIVMWIALCVVLVASDLRLAGLLRNSLLLAIGTAAISLPIGSVLGFLLMRCDLPGRRLLLCLIIGGMFLPLYVHSAAWSAGFGQLGWFPFVGQPPRPLLDGWRGAIWIHSVAAIPWVTLIVGFAARNVNRNLEELALLDASAGRVLFNVTFRSIAPALFAAFLWIVLMTTSEMTVSDIFRIRTYVEEVYLNSQLDRFSLAPILKPWTNEFEPATIGLGSQLLVGTLFSLLAFTLLTELSPKHSRTGPPLIFSLGRWKPTALLSTVLLIIVLFALPISNLVYKAGMQNIQTDNSTRSVWEMATLMNNLRLVPERYGDSFVWTLLLGISSAVITLTISLPVAWLARSGKLLHSIPAILLATSGFAFPGPTIALLLIALLDQPDVPLLIELYDRTLFAPAMAIAIRILPLVILFLWHSFRSINQASVEHAALEGVGPARRMYMFGIRQNTMSILAAGLLAMIFAIGDLTASNLVMPPRVDPLPRLIFGFIHSGVDDQVAVLSICNVLIMLPLVAALYVVVAIADRRNHSNRDDAV